ncbi:SDR family oxidoreductase [Billgrantia montanilacus]|uniref:SDR family NAD(P)-dependent oxidoreductase n=1 Tax=Billgrantia montanilacus TaxID=2282305 RepID=A0A368TUH2_9GAMM|nr:SDR family oxidoreductase [Halomonas montanilacus]RCV87996.1 SDR family NAD(P)-dependent oxidoreductase [Halomonas montanilacus]
MNKTVLITGAASGMGKATALLLAEQGYTVYAGVRSNSQELMEEAGKRGLELNTVSLDVQDTASIQSAVQHVIEKEGKIDVLVNNAGFGLLATLEEGTDEEIFKQFDVNVFGLIKMTREVLPHMRKAGSGVIVNISSFLGRMGLPLLSHYNASKYAVEGITDSLRFEVAPFGIRVHSVLAGLFGTNFVKKGLVANSQTTGDDSPYKELVAHFVPIVAKAINEGPDPQPIAQAVKDIIENEDSEIAVKVGQEAELFVPMRREMDDKAFEAKVKETFGL